MDRLRGASGLGVGAQTDLHVTTSPGSRSLSRADGSRGAARSGQGEVENRSGLRQPKVAAEECEADIAPDHPISGLTELNGVRPGSPHIGPVHIPAMGMMATNSGLCPSQPATAEEPGSAPGGLGDVRLGDDRQDSKFTRLPCSASRRCRGSLAVGGRCSEVGVRHGVGQRDVVSLVAVEDVDELQAALGDQLPGARESVEHRARPISGEV